MLSVFIKKIIELKRNKKRIEEKLKVKLSFNKNKVTVSGNPLTEYETSIVLEAIDSGFSTESALLILEDDIVFEKINIKDYTRRKNLDLIRGRIIGTHGKTKNTLEQIGGCEIVIKENNVSIIGEANAVNNTITVVINIIRGSKQTNAYKYLERINTLNKKRIN